jgi:ABC-type multidrug transport system ATPase subunit
MADVIVAEGLTKSYGTERGVIDLSFAVAPGEVFGYLGPNGAGKTTTIRTLLDFIRPPPAGRRSSTWTRRRGRSRSTGKRATSPVSSPCTSG